MKYFFLLLFLVSCSSSPKEVPLRAFNKRIYIPCTEKLTKEPKGKLCYRQCVKRTAVLKRCVEHKVIVEVFNNLDTFTKFSAAGFEFRIPSE